MRGFRNLVHRVPGRSEITQQREHARRHVEPDRIAGPAGRTGIVRHQHRDPPLQTRRGLEFRKRRHAIRDHRDPVGLRPVGHAGERQAVERRHRVLEGDGAGEHAAVELGQHHVHRQIGCAKPARAVEPCGALGGGDDRLKHGNAGVIERRFRGAVADRGECRGGNDDRRREPRHGVAQEGRGWRILQTCHEQRRRRETARGQCLAKRIDGRNVRGQQHRAIENDGNHRPALRYRRQQPVEADCLLGRIIRAEARQRLWLAASERQACMPGKPPQ